MTILPGDIDVHVSADVLVLGGTLSSVGTVLLILGLPLLFAIVSVVIVLKVATVTIRLLASLAFATAFALGELLAPRRSFAR
jgi:hypothetical protein